MAASTDPYSQVTDDDYIKVSETENDEFIEIPKEDNDSIMLSTIQTQFPDAIGLKFRGSSGAWRAIRAVDNIFEPPKGGWGDKAYCVSNSKGIVHTSSLSLVMLYCPTILKIKKNDHGRKIFCLTHNIVMFRA